LGKINLASGGGLGFNVIGTVLLKGKGKKGKGTV